MKKLIFAFCLMIGFLSATSQCAFSTCLGSEENYSPQSPQAGVIYDFTISGGQAFTQLTNDSILVDWNTSGVYTMTLTATLGNCVSTSTCQVTVANALAINAPPIGPFCLGDPTEQLTANPSGGTWTGTGVINNEFDPSVGNGTYQLQYDITDANGCTGTYVMDVTVNPSIPTPLIQNN